MNCIQTTTGTTGTGDITVSPTPAKHCRPLSDLAIGRTGVVIKIQDDATGDWELSRCTITGALTFSRDVVITGTNGPGVKTNFVAGTKTLYATYDANYLDGVDVAALAALTSADSTTRLFAMNAAGELLTLTAAVLKAYTTDGAAPVDSTAPSAPTNLASSSVAQTSFTITFTPGSDSVAVARSEWSLDGTTWTSIGSAVTFGVTGRTASTAYTVRVRTVDTSGNVSTAATLVVTTAAVAGDSTAPTMSGSITVSAITASGYTFSYTAGADNVAVDHYETSINGGTNWTSNALNLSRIVTGRPASTTDALRVRAHDAAGNISNVLTGTATTSAAAAGAASPFTASSRTGFPAAMKPTGNNVNFWWHDIVPTGAATIVNVNCALSTSNTILPTPMLGTSGQPLGKWGGPMEVNGAATSWVKFGFNLGGTLATATNFYFWVIITDSAGNTWYHCHGAPTLIGDNVTDAQTTAVTQSPQVMGTVVGYTVETRAGFPLNRQPAGGAANNFFTDIRATGDTKPATITGFISTSNSVRPDDNITWATTPKGSKGPMAFNSGTGGTWSLSNMTFVSNNIGTTPTNYYYWVRIVDAAGAVFWYRRNTPIVYADGITESVNTAYESMVAA